VTEGVSPSHLNNLLSYCPATGLLWWKTRPLSMFASVRAMNAWNAKNANRLAIRTITERGYLIGSIYRVRHRAHRVIWAMWTGTWPEDQIDHINGKRTDNRIMNLRSVLGYENQQNMKISSNNKSGCTGVSWCKKQDKWEVGIGSKGKTVHLGKFTKLDDAILARKSAEFELGYHYNHGRRL